MKSPVRYDDCPVNAPIAGTWHHEAWWPSSGITSQPQSLLLVRQWLPTSLTNTEGSRGAMSRSSDLYSGPRYYSARRNTIPWSLPTQSWAAINPRLHGHFDHEQGTVFDDPTMKAITSVLDHTRDVESNIEMEKPDQMSSGHQDQRHSFRRRRYWCCCNTSHMQSCCG